MNWRYFAPLAIFMVISGFLARGLFLNPADVPSVLIGKPAPPFKLQQLGETGAQFNTADMKGQVWMLNVWASWCIACRDEHPLFVALGKQHLLPIVGLNYKDTANEAQGWLQQFGNPYSVVAQDIEGRAGIDWGVIAVPETFVIDKQGNIQYKHLGPVNPQMMQETIVPLIHELIAAPA